MLPTSVLQRKAIVYVRQSTPQQVPVNLESQRRQYDLVEVARRGSTPEHACVRWAETEAVR